MAYRSFAKGIPPAPFHGKEGIGGSASPHKTVDEQCTEITCGSVWQIYSFCFAELKAKFHQGINWGLLKDVEGWPREQHVTVVGLHL